MRLSGNPNITLRQLWHFVTAAEAGSISEAARRLRMAPSAISMSLAELERLCGAQLTIKHKSRGLTLTPAGQLARAQARQILDLADELAHLTVDDPARIRGPLTVGCYMPLAPAMIPNMLQEFAAVCPEVDVNFIEGYHDDLQERLRTGSIDVAFLYDADLDADVRIAPLRAVDPYLLLGEAHPLAGQPVVDLLELAEEPVILFDAPPISTRVLDIFREHGVAPRIRHRSRSYATVRSLVGADMGYTVLYQHPAFDLSYAGLRVVSKALPVSETAAVPQVVAAWCADVRPNARTRAWVDVAVRKLGRPRSA